VLRTQETYLERIYVKAPGTQEGIKRSISSFFSYCMEKGIGDSIKNMKKPTVTFFLNMKLVKKVKCQNIS